MLSNKMQSLIVQIIPIFTLFLCLSISKSTLAKQVVSLATGENEPYIGEQLPNNGFVSELTTLAFERAGYEVDINYYPLARSRYLLGLGLVDGMLPTDDDPYLLDSVIYSEPFYSGNTGLMKKKSLTLPDALTDNDSTDVLLKNLKGYSVGVVRGASISPEFEQNKGLIKQLVPRDLTNLNLLHYGRVDLIAIDKYTAADLMVNHAPHLIGQLEFISPFLSQSQFHLAFSKKVPNHLQLVKDFNQSLKAMKADGTLVTILNKHGLYQPRTSATDKINLTIGTVSNKDMLLMQQLSSEFELSHPHINLTWKVLDENTLRKRLLSDFAINDGQFDVVTIGSYEALIWSKKGWLHPLQALPESYDEKDIFSAVHAKLTYNNRLYALPFYNESSVTYYRTDLFAAADIQMPDKPTYQQIKNYASLLHNPDEEIYGICLRGKPGWGENIALFTTMVNTYKGQWFDDEWHPLITTAPWHKALTLYTDLLTHYGPPNPTLNGYNENKALFAKGHCAMWIDATIAAGELFDPSRTPIANNVGLSNAPIAKTSTGSKWLWTWSLAISESSKNKQAAMDFITWATSKEYINTVAEQVGWDAVPPGTRKSTYQNKNYSKIAPFADFVLKTIESVNYDIQVKANRNYLGIQFVDIPEFPALGYQVGHKIAKVVEGSLSVEEALRQSQKLVDEQMKKSKYY